MSTPRPGPKPDRPAQARTGGKAPKVRPSRAKTPPPPPVNAPESAGQRIERELVAAAMRKVVNGQGKNLSRQEASALKRHEKDKEERLRWQYYGSIPQKHWRQMSGRQAKVLIEQAERYGIPVGGPTVNLPLVARALHDFLADNAVKLAKDEDELMNGGAADVT